MHKHTGGIDFFHDEIVETDREKQTDIKVREEHDLASFLYDIVTLQSLVNGEYKADWLGQARFLIKVARRKYLQENQYVYENEMNALKQYK